MKGNAEGILTVIAACFLCCLLVSAAVAVIRVHAASTADNTSVHTSTPRVARTEAPTPPIPKEPRPTLDLNGTAVYVLFKFGAWVRVAYNNSKLTAPVAVYVYAHNLPVTIKSNYGQGWQGYWGLALNLTKLDLDKPLILWIKYKNKEYTLRFTVVKSLNKTEKKVAAVITLDKVKEWLDREAQYAAVIALIAIVTAFSLKRKLLLLKTFNGVNVAVVTLVGAAIWILAPRVNHSEWLTLPFVLSYLTTYRITPAGRKIYLIKLIPSMRKILWETAVLYRTAEGMMAYAKQSVSEAFKRLLGKHIILKDAEIGKLGEISNDKFWTVEDVEFYEKSEALLVLDAQLTRERIVEEKEGGLYE